MFEFADQQYEQVGVSNCGSRNLAGGNDHQNQKPQEEELAYYRHGLIIYALFSLAALLVNSKLLDIGIRLWPTTLAGDGGLPCLKPMSQIAGACHSARC